MTDAPARPLSEEEVAELRSGSYPDGFYAATLRILATIDALRERAEAAERERGEARLEVHSLETRLSDASCTVTQFRLRAETAERERDAALAQVKELEFRCGWQYGRPPFPDNSSHDNPYIERIADMIYQGTSSDPGCAPKSSMEIANQVAAYLAENAADARDAALAEARLAKAAIKGLMGKYPLPLPSEDMDNHCCTIEVTFGDLRRAKAAMEGE